MTTTTNPIPIEARVRSHRPGAVLHAVIVAGVFRGWNIVTVTERALSGVHPTPEEAWEEAEMRIKERKGE